MEKEHRDRQIPLIPGVSRGEDFFRGKTVEMTGQELGSKRRMEYGEKPLDLCLIDIRKAEYAAMPFLGRDEDSSKRANYWEPRVDPVNGSVITWRWKDPEEGKHDFSDYIHFAGRKINEKFTLSKIPASWTVGILVPQRVKGGIEAAMRQQDEIAHDYRKGMGPEDDRVTETFSLLYEASSAFVMGDVNNEEDLRAAARIAESLFKDHGLLESVDSIWERVVNFTLMAAEKDRLGRVNPLVSRVRIRAAFLAATEREMIGRSVGTKAEKVYWYLAVVRAGIRTRIQMSVDILDDLCGFSKGKIASDQVMREGSLTNSKLEGEEIEKYIRTVTNDILRGIQPAPYLIPVTAARVILGGGTIFKNNEEKIIFSKVLGGNGYSKFLNDSATRHLREGKTLVARTRMYLAYQLLKQSLNDPRTTDIRVFDR